MTAIVPSWQQLPPQHAAIQQPLLSDAGDWGRSLIVEGSAILQVEDFSINMFCVIVRLFYICAYKRSEKFL
jgi:hypothetical protein